MATPAIKVEGLGKRYRLVHGQERSRYRTLRDTLADAVKAPFRKRGTSEEFWALNDVSFEVQPGEVVGIIGRNGAGKSTLLKILSRITKPTRGRVEINGRVGSLLEVGTGFHPELTGRENVYLNGAILGMSRREIAKKFDEIVAFAEVEKFLDTPVKRYSSGMYVRLAFAVAAHLEPEILIVDEVLAVGDAAFQKKCFRAMKAVGQLGRTVLLVSHDLTVVRNLCQTAFLIDRGRLLDGGPVQQVVSDYLGLLASGRGQTLADRSDREGDGRARITDLFVTDSSGARLEHVLCGAPAAVVVGYASTAVGSPLEVALSVWSPDGQKLFHIDTHIRGVTDLRAAADGQVTCDFPKLPLPPGHYTLNAMLKVGGQIADHVYSAGSFHVLVGDFYATGQPTPSGGGVVLIDHSWR